MSPLLTASSGDLLAHHLDR